MVVVVVYVGILLMLTLAVVLPSLAIAGAAFGFLALIIRINPAWSFWLSEPFYAPVWLLHYKKNGRRRGGLRYHRLVGILFKNLRWVQLSYGEGDLRASGPNANRRRQSFMFMLALISVSLLIASVVIGV